MATYDHHEPTMATDQPPPNPLSGPGLSKIMVASLPKDASPHLNSVFDAIALATHASMIGIGFRLVGLGEDHPIEAHSDYEQTKPLPSEWNATNGSYAFRYRHSQSSMEFLVKVNRLGNRAVVMGMAVGDDKPTSFDFTAHDYVSAGNLPLTLDIANTEEAEKKICDAFITVGRLSDYGSLMRVHLIQKLAPSLRKDGYQETTEGQSSAGGNRQPAPGRGDPRPQYDPLRQDRDPRAQPAPQHQWPQPFPNPRAPRGPLPEPMPGFDDEMDLQRPPRGMGQGGLGRLGERDLYPQGLGPNDPLWGGVGPGVGGFGGGGMHPTFDDALFAGQGGFGGGHNPQAGGRGAGYNPQAPPGSRYDEPFGPGGPAGGHPRGAGMGGRPPNPFGGYGDGDFI